MLLPIKSTTHLTTSKVVCLYENKMKMAADC
jgi:hypothetical protein